MEVTRLVFETDRSVREDASKLRGYIGGQFREYTLLHNHTAGGVLNVYPKVQYRVLEGVPMLVGVGREARRVLTEVGERTERLKLGRSEYAVRGSRIFSSKEELCPTRGMVQYRFLCPWLAFNRGNYQRYRELREWKEKKELLSRILVGNILSLCKGLMVVVQARIYAHTHVDPVKIRYKSVHVIGLTGEFRTNFLIPDFLGVGKGVSQGFGVVRKMGRSRDDPRSDGEGSQGFPQSRVRRDSRRGG
jgi:hypothetical protein